LPKELPSIGLHSLPDDLQASGRVRTYPLKLGDKNPMPNAGAAVSLFGYDPHPALSGEVAV
jgi:hypothetical protein